MPPRVFATRAVSLALLALLLMVKGPRSVEASAVATDDACFYDVASGTCVASAVWVTGQHGLLRTPRANLLADVAAGIETCASAFGDAEARARHAGTCDYDATFIPNENGGFESVGGCFPTLSWATALAERCLAHVSDADAAVSALLATAAACVARAESRERCAADAKCAWTETDADGGRRPGILRAGPPGRGGHGAGRLGRRRAGRGEDRVRGDDPRDALRLGPELRVARRRGRRFLFRDVRGERRARARARRGLPGAEGVPRARRAVRGGAGERGGVRGGGVRGPRGF